MSDDLELKLAQDFEPYLDAALQDTETGDREFDENVTNAKELAMFLARLVTRTLGETI